MTHHPMTALDVAKRLENTRYAGDQWCTFREVRSGTGFARKREGYADLLAVSIWPSRGIYIEGVEIKMSRSDWRAELRNPKKADAFIPHCRYWFVAAPKGVVEVEEVPDTWGYIEVGHKRNIVRKRPAANDAKPPDLMLFASLVRHLKHSCGYSEDDVSRLAARKTNDLNAELSRSRDRCRQLERFERIAGAVEKFESASGLSIHDPWTAGDIGTVVKLLVHTHPQRILSQLTAFTQSLQFQLRELEKPISALRALLDTHRSDT